MRGARVGITAHRRAAEQARLVEALGGVPVMGRTLEADVPRRVGAFEDEVRAALAGPIDVAVFLTGVGAELTVQAADRMGLGDLLRRRLDAATVIARGPKPRRELRGLGIRIDWTVEQPASTLLIRDRLVREGPEGRRVLVQAFAEPPTALTAPLEARGATCPVLNPYVLGWPQDQAPARRLARAAADGAIDAITFTTARAAQHFLAIAETAGIDARDLQRGGALMAAVGPVTQAALESEGLPVHLVADPPKMGTMYHMLAVALAAGATGWAPSGAPVRGHSEPATVIAGRLRRS
ncbi:MAG: uroporphyrinogen-III synthase [Thermoleophilia bacterium]